MRYLFILYLLTAFFYIACSDHQSPEVSVNIPDDGSLVQGIATVHVSASDNQGIDSVALFIDDDLICGYTVSPFLYSWNTHVLPDSSVHALYAIAIDEVGNEGCSDTIAVTVFNGSLVFADNFESYVPGHQLAPIWRDIWPGVMESTYVSQSLPHAGVKSYRSFGYADYVRTDGIGISIANCQRVAYEYAVLIPGESGNGALVGFFVRIHPQVGEIYNGVLFDPADHKVYVRGVLPDTTGFTWTADVWYSVRVMMDFEQAYMDVWLDQQQVAVNIPLADSSMLDTFAIATVYGFDGSVYYDDVRISRE